MTRFVNPVDWLWAKHATHMCISQKGAMKPKHFRFLPLVTFDSPGLVGHVPSELTVFPAARENDSGPVGRFARMALCMTALPQQLAQNSKFLLICNGSNISWLTSSLPLKAAVKN